MHKGIETILFTSAGLISSISAIYDPTAYMHKGIETKWKCPFWAPSSKYDPTAYMHKGIETFEYKHIFYSFKFYMTRPHICTRGLKHLFCLATTFKNSLLWPDRIYAQGDWNELFLPKRDRIFQKMTRPHICTRGLKPIRRPDAFITFIYDPTAYMHKGIETTLITHQRSSVDVGIWPDRIYAQGDWNQFWIKTHFCSFYMTRPHICTRGLKHT